MLFCSHVPIDINSKHCWLHPVSILLPGLTACSAALIYTLHNKEILSSSKELTSGHFGYCFILAWVCVPLLLGSGVIYNHLRKKEWTKKTMPTAVLEKERIDLTSQFCPNVTNVYVIWLCLWIVDTCILEKLPGYICLSLKLKNPQFKSNNNLLLFFRLFILSIVVIQQPKEATYCIFHLAL